MQSHCVLRALRWTTAAVFAYLCAGELLPLPFQLLDVRDWQTQQVVMLTILTSLAVLIGRVGRCTGYSSSFHCDSIVGALHLLTLFNTVPIVIAAIATPLALSPDGCPRKECGYLSDFRLHRRGTRLAHLTSESVFYVSVKICTCAEMTNGWFDVRNYPLHNGGWWCAGQSALHSVAYIMLS